MEDTKRPLSCEEALRQLFAYLDRAISGEPMAALEAHFDACLDCCERLEFSRKVDAHVRQRLGDAPVPAGLEERIRRLIAG